MFKKPEGFCLSYRFLTAFGLEYWISCCKKNGNDTLYPGIIEIDEDAREEYWIEIRKKPENVHLTRIRSAFPEVKVTWLHPRDSSRSATRSTPRYNSMSPPDNIRIPYEDFDGARFDCVGRYGDGNQFITYVTGAFPGRERYSDPTGDWQEQKSWNAVINRFDSDGNHIGSEAKRGGYDIDGRHVAGDSAWQHLDSMLPAFGLQNPERCDIYIKQFSVEIEGVVYELEYVNASDEEDGYEHECVMLWPNDIMFHPPWDSGEYST